MNRFTVNNKQYTAKPFDVNMVCDLEDYGVSLEEMKKKAMSMIRAYFAICADLDKDSAGIEIQQHLIGGGKFEDITAPMNKEMEESDFFRALDTQAEKRNSENQTEETTATS